VLSLTRPLNGLTQKGMVSDLMVGLNFSKKLLKAVLNFTVKDFMPYILHELLGTMLKYDYLYEYYYTGIIFGKYGR
jgi:hypothetical protein